ncbi:MAG: dihydrolipoyl dehydrogenase family protein [Gammaproteobacteria bacterium]
MAKYQYNLAVIGAGSAGLVSSYVAAAAKAKVALIERHKMGGDCLNTGCVPSKAIIRSASFMRDIRRAKQLGFRRAEAEFDFADIMARVHRVIAAIEPHDSVERYTELGVECHQGEASMLSPNEVQVGDKRLTARSIIIASGARPFVPPIKGLDKVDYKTSDTIWQIREQPKRMIVVGGGPIGTELAQAFAYLGSEVVQVESSERILIREDKDASHLVMAQMKEAGVQVMTKARAQEIEVGNDGQAYMVLTDVDSGETTRRPFDLLLLAVGRQPNGDSIPGLAETGVKINKRGAVEVDDCLRTAVPNIYACGDVIGSYQFTHTAAHGAVTAVRNALTPFLPFKKKIDWSVVPWCTFSHPEVARVGLNEQEAKAQNIPFEAVKYGIDDLDRAIADEEAEGFVKLITTPKGKLLGVTIVGAHAGDLLHEYILAMKQGATVKDVHSMIHIYPTMAEASRFAAGEWSKKHLPHRALSAFGWINRFLRG